MKMLLYLLFVSLAVASMDTLGPSAESHSAWNARRAADLVRMADKVIIRGEMEPASAGIVIEDRSWMETLATALSQTSFGNGASCLCCGWQTAYFYKNGAQIFQLAAIHGHQLRAYSERGGADFTVDEQHWQLIANLIHAKAAAAKAAISMPKAMAPPRNPKP